MVEIVSGVLCMCERNMWEENCLEHVSHRNLKWQTYICMYTSTHIQRKGGMEDR